MPQEVIDFARLNGITIQQNSNNMYYSASMRVGPQYAVMNLFVPTLNHVGDSEFVTHTVLRQLRVMLSQVQYLSGRHGSIIENPGDDRMEDVEDKFSFSDIISNAGNLQIA